MSIQELIDELQKVKDKTQKAVDQYGNEINEVWDLAGTDRVAIWNTDNPIKLK